MKRPSRPSRTNTAIRTRTDAGGAELAGVALRTKHGEQILEGVAESFAVVVVELVNDLEKHLERLRVAVGQIGILEHVAKKGRDAGIFRHLSNAFSVETEHLMSAESGAHEIDPPILGKVAGKEFSLAAEFLRFGIHVVHKLVNQGDRYLLNLRFRIGDFTHENVAGGVDSASGIGV